MPVHTYTNWNSRPSDQKEQIEPFRKYYFICEGANTETFYFRRLIDGRKRMKTEICLLPRILLPLQKSRNRVPIMILM